MALRLHLSGIPVVPEVSFLCNRMLLPVIACSPAGFDVLADVDSAMLPKPPLPRPIPRNGRKAAPIR